MTAPFMVRQGDVALVATSDVALSVGAEPVPRIRGRIELARGIVTGHVHAVLEDAVVLFQDGEQWFLRVGEPASLVHIKDDGSHAEHDPIDLPPATYLVLVQREYVPGELPQTVMD